MSGPVGYDASDCRLDPGALERCVAETASRLRFGANLMVLTKCGKQEADGRGFRSLIAVALVAGTPMIAGSSPESAKPFEESASGLTIKLPAKQEVMRDWAIAATGTRNEPT
jgi:hypothetical protein